MAACGNSANNPPWAGKRSSWSAWTIPAWSIKPLKCLSLDKTDKPDDGALVLVRIENIPAASGLAILHHDETVCEESLPVEVSQEGYAMEIAIPGYGAVAYLELDCDGHPTLYVYADDANDEPTHTISLAKAKKSPQSV